METFNLEVKRLTEEVVENPRSVDDFDCTDFIFIDEETLNFHNVSGFTPVKFSRKIFSTMLHDIERIFDQYCVSVKVEEDDKEIGEDLIEYFSEDHEGYLNINIIKVKIIIRFLHHFVDLQVAMGKTTSEAETRAYILIYEKYLTYLEILSNT